MAMFPVLEFEEKVQVKDKTRISGTKSFVSKNEDPIEDVDFTIGGTTVTVSDSGLPADITQFDEWYTDWYWDSWSFDVDSTNNKIDFEEAGVDLVASVSASTYTSLSSLVSAIQTAMNSVATGTFTVTVDENDKITWTSDVQFSLLPSTGVNKFTGLLQHIGVEFDTDTGLSAVGEPVEYGLKKISLTVDNGSTPVTVDMYQKLYTERGDRLFSSDSELLAHEEDILKWVPKERSSFKDIHRKVQQLILDWLDAQGFTNEDRKPFTKWDFPDLKEMREWATYYALQLIFEGNSNAVDDIFDRKAQKYEAKTIRSRNRFLSLDIDKDGKIDFDENLRLHVGSLYRR